MKNQEKENELYKAIGQYLIDSLHHNSIDNWDKSFLTVKSSGDGLTILKLEYVQNGKREETSPMFASESRINLYDVIDDLREYTNNNDYVKWNKFIFELNSSEKFEINYLWDKYFHDERE